MAKASLLPSDLDRRIEELCERRRLRFAPWHPRPWRVPDDGSSPWGPGCAGSRSWAAAQELRRRLIAELESDGAR